MRKKIHQCIWIDAKLYEQDWTYENARMRIVLFSAPASLSVWACKFAHAHVCGRSRPLGFRSTKTQFCHLCWAKDNLPRTVPTARCRLCRLKLSTNNNLLNLAWNDKVSLMMKNPWNLLTRSSYDAHDDTIGNDHTCLCLMVRSLRFRLFLVWFITFHHRYF